MSTSEPLLERDAGSTISIDRLRFVPLLGNGHPQLVFSASTYAGNHTEILVVLDVSDARSKVVHLFASMDGIAWRVRARDLVVQANLYTVSDSVCCPSRQYRFTLGARKGAVTETSDDRPFVGVVVGGPYGNRILGIIPRAPAVGRLRLGDSIVGLVDPPPAPYADMPATFFTQIAELRPGDETRIVVRRNGRRMVVPIVLGSLASPAAQSMTFTGLGLRWSTAERPEML